MRTAVYALAALAAASGASAFMPQAGFAGRAPSLRARASVRQSATVGAHSPLASVVRARLRAPIHLQSSAASFPSMSRMCGNRLPLRKRGTGRN